jgi:hypothetical protein
MAMKCTGVELKRFHDDNQFWPEDAYFDDLELEVNGKVVADDFSITDDLQPNDQVRILAGWVHGIDGNLDCPFETYFRRWRRKQETAYLSVAVPRDRLDALKAAIAAAGGKVQD